MSKKVRFVLLFLCLISFLIIAPILIGYSIGYRFDFENKKIVETGGIYIRTYPAAESIIVDSKITGKPGIFSNAFFVQSLLPKNHTVLIKKEGYFDYYKVIPVKEKEVTKLENIILFKKKVLLLPIKENVNFLSISPNFKNFLIATYKDKKIDLNYFEIAKPDSSINIPIASEGKILEIYWHPNSQLALIKTKLLNKFYYYLFQINQSPPRISLLPNLNEDLLKITFNPNSLTEFFFLKNNKIYSFNFLKNEGAKILIENVIDYQIYNNHILWFSKEGGLHLSDFSGVLKENLSQNNLIVDKNKKYEIILLDSLILLKENNSLLLFNSEEKKWVNFDSPSFVYKLVPSPNNKNLIYCGEKEIYIYSFLEKEYQKIISGDNIKNCLWLNNDYIIFVDKDNIIISEIDYRGNINKFNLKETFLPPDDHELSIKNPEILFIPSNAKLYLLTENKIWETEKILP